MLEYTLIRKNNKNLYLRIREGKVVVTAPKNVSKAYVDQFVCKHRSWIEQHLTTSKKPLQNLDTIYIFGKPYTICFDNIASKDPSIIKYRSDIKSFQTCIRLKIQDVFLQRFQMHCERMHIEGLKLRIGFFKSKWGSFHPTKKEVSLNGNLAFTDIECLDAIIVHELCHVSYRNHSSAFYKEVLHWMPNYKEVHKRLNSYEIPILKKDA